jgi:type I restriction enzyme R subunit
MSHFEFLRQEWPSVHEAAIKAEAAALSDPRTSCFYARRALELAVQWAFLHDKALRTPYQDNISALLHEPSFKQTAGEAVFAKAKLVIQLGNAAVHSNRPIPESNAVSAVRELFHVLFWLGRTYARLDRPHSTLIFEPSALPRSPALAQTQTQLQAMQEALEAKDKDLAKAHKANAELDQELERVRAEVAQAKKAAAAIPDDHDYSEAQTRDLFIDLLLREAGWPLDQARDREFEVMGMSNNQGVGFVDYVLWGDDGKPLGLLEAKRTRKDPRVGQQQAKLYADCLERQFGQRPVIFWSNGYEHWIWDDSNHPPRRVQGFYKKSELELLVQRRQSRRLLAQVETKTAIAERFYQTRAIRRVTESFEKDCERKALLVMATGSGKTRTVIALVDLLMKANWAKRVLFLADRVALVNQAVRAFKTHLPDSAPVNLVTEKNTEGRVYVSTYPTMMGLIDEMGEGQRRFGVGHFDLIVIDEAHRSVYQKYGAIFEYFDSLLVGLTATPVAEIDRNTYSLFDLEKGVPTDAYPLEEAVKDGFLVPPRAVSVPLRFQREGIRYDDLPDEDKEQWDTLEWDEDGSVPAQVEPEAVNQWLFNKDTVDKVLEHLMTHGLKVAGGDRLGKTILFAKNQAHADFIAERFDINYPSLRGEFARVVTFKTEYAQSLIDAFSIPDKAPHLAISVDMLDTGIDVPEVVNLVFFKIVRSKTKFWQMLGRGTRLRQDLFGPGLHKEFFFVFDYCQNLEFFQADPQTTEGSTAPSLGARLFQARLELVRGLENSILANPIIPGEGQEHLVKGGLPGTEQDVRESVVRGLHEEVASMNMDNFVVRPHRRWVERFAKLEAWSNIDADAWTGLAQDVAELPTELPPQDEEAKRFDLLMLKLQLGVLHPAPGFERLRDQVRRIAALLEAQSSIPAIRLQLELILELQSDEWWQDVTVPILEGVRRRLRDLVKLIEKGKRKVVYTDFEDTIGEHSEVDLPGFAQDDFEKFRSKARVFLRAHEDHLAIHKLRRNVPLTKTDLVELERILAESGTGSLSTIEQAKAEAHGLGLFVRSLIGLDREAAKEALAFFEKGKALTSNQLEFSNLIVDHLTDHGVMDASRLYESPFTDIAPSGPESLFSSNQIDELVAALDTIRSNAA